MYFIVCHQKGWPPSYSVLRALFRVQKGRAVLMSLHACEKVGIPHKSNYHHDYTNFCVFISKKEDWSFNVRWSLMREEDNRILPLMAHEKEQVVWFTNNEVELMNVEDGKLVKHYCLQDVEAVSAAWALTDSSDEGRGYASEESEEEDGEEAGGDGERADVPDGGGEQAGGSNSGWADVEGMSDIYEAERRRFREERERKVANAGRSRQGLRGRGPTAGADRQRGKRPAEGGVRAPASKRRPTGIVIGRMGASATGSGTTEVIPASVSVPVSVPVAEVPAPPTVLVPPLPVVVPVPPPPPPVVHVSPPPPPAVAPEATETPVVASDPPSASAPSLAPEASTQFEMSSPRPDAPSSSVRPGTVFTNPQANLE